MAPVAMLASLVLRPGYRGPHQKNFELTKRVVLPIDPATHARSRAAFAFLAGREDPGAAAWYRCGAGWEEVLVTCR